VISDIRTKRWLIRLLLALLVTAGANLMAAGGLAIDSVTVSATDDALIEILFSCPNRYLDDYPQGETDVLQINLQRMEQCDSLNLRSDLQEVDAPGNSELASLASIEYESQREEDAILRIRFDRPVRAVVSQSSNQRLLSITVEAGHPVSAPPPLYTPTATLPTASADPEAQGAGSGVALGKRQLSETQLESLMGEGEAAILQENYSRAIQIYTRVLRATENAYTPQALELLGLSRERNGQIAHAVSEYRRYLEHYPDQEGADRVNQRLAGLLTAHKTPRPGRARGTAAKSPSPWDVYGGLAQYYRHDTFKLDGMESINAQSSILTDADLVLRRRGKRIDFSGRATLGNLWDLLGEDKGPGNRTRFYQGYVEVADQVTGLSGKLGRQTLRTSGVLGRFDGLHLAWEFRPGMRFNLMGGYPVDTTEDGIETHRHFYGAAIDFEQVADLVDLSFFYNLQKIDGLQNREAIGAEARYFDESKSLIALIDYDIGFKKLNNLVLQGNWHVRESLTLSAAIDQRTSPYLTTRNALIGQPVRTIKELLLIYSGDEIRQLAEDRSGKYRSYRLGASQSLSERFQLNADFSMTKLGGTTASAGVLEIPDQDTLFYYSLNLVGSRLFMDGDTSIFGLRYIDSGRTATSTLSIDSRFPVNAQLRINPRFRVSYRDTNLVGRDSWIVFPSLRLLYRIGRRFRLDFEVGGQWIDQKSEDDRGDRSSWFLYFGYRVNF
jgi:tetratricopeptide (TPR) repeat protein